MLRPIEIRIAFRGGFRWPLRENDAVEIWRGNELLGTLTGETVRHLIQHHVYDVEVRRYVVKDMTEQPRLPFYVPTPGMSPSKRAALSAKRKGRK